MNLDGETALKPKHVVDKELFRFIRPSEKESESVVDEVNFNGKSETKGRNINKYGEQLSKLKGVID